MRVLIAIGAVAASASAAQLPPAAPPADTGASVRESSLPYQRKPVQQPAALPAQGPASTPATAAPAALATPAAQRVFSLLASDVDVQRAFARWTAKGKPVQWLLGRALPIDTPAEGIQLSPKDTEDARGEGATDPELIAAMLSVARAFARSETPFAVVEYDNAIVIQPKGKGRP